MPEVQPDDPVLKTQMKPSFMENSITHMTLSYDIIIGIHITYDVWETKITHGNNFDVAILTPSQVAKEPLCN